MKIVVTSNCQTAGLTASIQALVPSAEVDAAPVTLRVDGIAPALKGADIWVTTHPHLSGDFGGDVVKVPTLFFSAFHPDIGYFRNTDGATLRGAAGIDYNSNIVLWSYLSGVDEQTSRSLFRHEVFKSIGYLDGWATEFEALKASFSKSDIDFQSFMLPMLRAGVFMHTVNHPKINALYRIAELVIQKIGMSPQVTQPYVPDGLAVGTLWPLYPGIAESFSRRGSLAWRIRNQDGVVDLEEFIAMSYASYDSQNLRDKPPPAPFLPQFEQALQGALS